MQDKLNIGWTARSENALSISDLHKKFLDGELYPSVFLSRCFEKIREDDGRLHALITVMESEAKEAAAESDRRYTERKPLSLIDGIPIGIKDNIDFRGRRCTAGTSVYQNRVSSETAEIVYQLSKAGGVVVGKTNLYEAAFGGTTNNPFYGCCENPLHLGYTSGGSSGGSAAGVAAGFFNIGVGTDTMGSVRIPSAYCGLWGFIPTPSQVSRKGVVPLSPTLDRLGFITSSVQDLQSTWTTLLGKTAISRSDENRSILNGLRMGVLAEECFWSSLGSLSSEQRIIQSAYDGFLAVLQQSGVHVVKLDVDRPYFATARKTALMKTENEAAQYWAGETGQNFNGLSDGLSKMLSYGQNLSPEKLVDIDKTLSQIKKDVSEFFTHVDVIFMPTVLGLPFKHSDNIPEHQADLCVLANVAEVPAVGIPFHRMKDWPLSFQLLMQQNTDQKLLQLASVMHRALQPGVL